MASQLLLIGEFDPSHALHLATNSAIGHACRALNVNVEYEWLSTDAIQVASLDHRAGLWVAPGSPYKNLARTLWAIREARERGLPCLGTCGGFQHMILEYARNVLGFADAHHAEYDPYASRFFVSRLACSLVGRTMDLTFQPESQVARIYGGTQAREQYYCNFGVAPECVPLLKQGQLKVSGSDAEGEVRVIELPDHPFFIGTLFVPQARSTAEHPHPIVTAFIKAISESQAAAVSRP